jgi:hypothetical protein
MGPIQSTEALRRIVQSVIYSSVYTILTIKCTSIPWYACYCCQYYVMCLLLLSVLCDMLVIVVSIM